MSIVGHVAVSPLFSFPHPKGHMRPVLAKGVVDGLLIMLVHIMPSVIAGFMRVGQMSWYQALPVRLSLTAALTHQTEACHCSSALVTLSPLKGLLKHATMASQAPQVRYTAVQGLASNEEGDKQA